MHTAPSTVHVIHFFTRFLQSLKKGVCFKEINNRKMSMVNPQEIDHGPSQPGSKPRVVHNGSADVGWQE